MTYTPPKSFNIEQSSGEIGILGDTFFNSNNPSPEFREFLRAIGVENDNKIYKVGNVYVRFWDTWDFYASDRVDDLIIDKGDDPDGEVDNHVYRITNVIKGFV